MGLAVGGVQQGSPHAPAQKHLVDVSDECVELLIVDTFRVSEVGVAVLRADSDPMVRSPHKVWTQQDAVPVVLEALCRVDAADLAEAGRLAGPQRRRRRAADRALALEIPRPGPAVNLHVGHERAVLPRIAPRPAVAGSHPGAVALLKL